MKDRKGQYTSYAPLRLFIAQTIGYYTMTRLSININKVATLRNARGGNNPDLIRFAADCERFGGQGITVHPRPDERHIRRDDVFALRPLLTTEFNIEGFPSDDFIDLVLSVRPDQVTLVPDSPEQLTSNHGWDTNAHASFLTAVTRRLKEAGIRVSIFVDPSREAVKGAAEVGADRVELYTEPYAAGYATDRDAAIRPFIEAANTARNLRLGLNAGHDLSLENLAFYHARIPWTDEVSIGHALICDSLNLGLSETVKRYLDCLK